MNNDERLQVLLKSRLLDSDPEEAFDRFTQLAVALLDVPMSIVSLVDKDRQFFKSYCGLSEPWTSRRQTPLSHSLCQHVVASRQPLIVNDTRRVAELKENLAISELGMIAYLGFPLLVEGQSLGSFCVADTRPRAWSQRDIRVVQALASLVEEEIVIRIEPRDPQKAFLQEEQIQPARKPEDVLPSIKRYSEMYLEHMTDAFWYLDAQFRVLYMNQKAEWYTPSSQKGWQGQKLWDLAPPIRGTPLEQQLRQAMENRQIIEFEMPGPIQQRWVEVHAYPMHDGLCVYCHDIHERKQAEEALKESERQKDLMLSMTSHELKTPLAALKGMLQLSQRRMQRVTRAEARVSPAMQVFFDGLARALEDSLRQIDRQTHLINDLLDISQITAGTLKLEQELCDLVALVRETIEGLRVIAPQRALMLDISEQTVAMVLADQARISQVVTNYVTNAIRYSPADQPVRIGIDLEEQTVRVWVQDQGPGLTEEARARLWQRFSQIKEISAQGGSGKGLGLGLYICQTLIAQHQGKVGVESTPGKGSTFWFALPLLGS